MLCSVESRYFASMIARSLRHSSGYAPSIYSMRKWATESHAR